MKIFSLMPVGCRFIQLKAVLPGLFKKFSASWAKKSATKIGQIDDKESKFLH
jgi:hypothetical protein